MSITDGTFVCSLCGEWLSGCSLCGEAPMTDMRPTIAAEERREREGEIELYQQERAIRRAAEQSREGVMSW